MKPSPATDDIDDKATKSARRVNGTTKKWWVLIAIGVGTFMTALDTSAVNTILPIMNRSFNSNIAIIEWVVTIYLLVLSGLLLSFGRLGDLRGHKIVYIAGFIIFLVSSALCGLAPSVVALVIFRAIQALGAAMLSANSPAILTKSFPASQRGQALGLQATMIYLGLTIGPSLGGWLADQFSWRVIFYINVPIGLLALLLGIRFIVLDRPERKIEQFDIPGALIFIGGLVFLLLGLNQGHALGWTSPVILILLGTSGILLAFFVVIEQRTPNPMLDLNLFANRLFSAATTSAILNYISVFSIIFLMPFYLIQGRGFTPTQTGLILTTMPIVMAVVAPISGTASDRVGTRLPTMLGMSFLAAGLFLLSWLNPDSSPVQIALALGVSGLGTGTFISPNNSAVMGAAPNYRQGIAAGVLATARNVGMVLGVGLSGAILTTFLGYQQEPLSTYLHAASLFEAIHFCFLAATGIAIMGILTSATRQEKPSEQKLVRKSNL